MAEVDIYSSVLDYMCENYDYSLYATDFNSKAVSSLQRSIASVPTQAGVSRNEATKTALQDFFDAIFQKVFVYEDEERLKIVKYFDNGAIQEEQDRQIHALRLELVKYKDDVASTVSKNDLFIFDKSSRKRFELTLLLFGTLPIKEIIREQMSLVFDLDTKDIVIFINEKIFLKKFIHKENKSLVVTEKLKIFDDKRFVVDLWKEVQNKLKESFKSNFVFLKYDRKEFYEKYPQKFFSIIKVVVKNSFSQISEEEVIQYTNRVFKEYLPRMLTQVAHFVLHEVLEGELKAIKFLKYYSESTRIHNNKIKLEKVPMMDTSGKIYKYAPILTLLKNKELLDAKRTHKRVELKNIQDKVKKSLFIVQRSEDEMEKIQKRRLKLLCAMKKVEEEIAQKEECNISDNVSINKLEFSKRDLVEAFKQVEIRLRTQINILNNANKELQRWEDKRNKKNISKAQLDDKYRKIEQEYKTICEVFATALSKEPIEFKI